MRTLQVVMPMAGLGTRFQAKNYTSPKPLIEVDKMPMFVKAISSLKDLNGPKEYTFIVRQEHVTSHKIDQIVKDQVPTARVIVTNEPPIGAAVDCYRAKSEVKPDDSVVFMDCDLYFRSEAYNGILKECLMNTSDQPVSGAIVCFHSQEGRYSYAKVDNGLVTETAEKKVISDYAIVGSYFFNSAKLIFDNLEKYISGQLASGAKEYYLAPIYNRYVEKGLKIKACLVDEYHSFGTPEELEGYEKSR